MTSSGKVIDALFEASLQCFGGTTTTRILSFAKRLKTSAESFAKVLPAAAMTSWGCVESRHIGGSASVSLEGNLLVSPDRLQMELCAFARDAQRVSDDVSQLYRRDHAASESSAINH